MKSLHFWSAHQIRHHLPELGRWYHRCIHCSERRSPSPHQPAQWSRTSLSWSTPLPGTSAVGWGLPALSSWPVCSHFYRSNNIKTVNTYGICNKNYFIMTGTLKFYTRLAFSFFKNMLSKTTEILIKTFTIMLKHLAAEPQNKNIFQVLHETFWQILPMK